MLVKITNGKVDKFPYSINDLKKSYSNVSFPKNISKEMLAEYGVFEVKQTLPPKVDKKTHTYSYNIELVNDEWTQVWSINSLKEDIAAENIRYYRNSLLMESDWTQGNDIDDFVSKSWASYRQALRDLPEQQGFPWDVQWPTKPE